MDSCKPRSTESYGTRSAPYTSSTLVHDLSESLILWLLALTGTGGFVVGRIPVLGLAFCLTLATAYTIPLINPTTMAVTLGTVTGASKKMRPDSAIGSLFKAPTIE